MLQYLFGKEESCIYEKEGQTLVRANTKHFSRHCFQNWDKNRPPDPVRVKEIVDYYQNNEMDLIPGIIHVWKKQSPNTLMVVYDGIHRLFAAYESNRPMTMILMIRTTSREQDIIHDFINLNKSISVPTVYLNGDKNTRLICEMVIDRLCKRYEPFRSASRTPHPYNFNRDQWIEYLSNFIIDFTMPDITEILHQVLQDVNLKAKAQILKEKKKYPKKCAVNDFFLFGLSKEWIRQEVEQRIGKTKND